MWARRMCFYYFTAKPLEQNELSNNKLIPVTLKKGETS